MDNKNNHDPMNLVALMNLAPRCGAKNRQGKPCMAPAMRGRNRCRLHGGKSLRGKEHGSYKHGFYTDKAKKEREEMRELIRSFKQMLEGIS